MKSFLLFKAKSLDYAIDLEMLEHIMIVPELTKSADSDDISEGMMSYNEDVIDIYSFRKMIGIESVYNDTIEMFSALKNQHKAWIDALDDTVHKGVKFTKTTNHNACQLGKWIDNFVSNNDEVSNLLRQLKTQHSLLHKSAIDVLEYYDHDHKKAIDWVDSYVKDIYSYTIGYLDEIAKHSKQVANDSQKMLILTNKQRKYGLKVDEVDKIIHVNSEDIMINDSLRREDEFLIVSGVLKHNNKLVSIIEKFILKDNV